MQDWMYYYCLNTEIIGKSSSQRPIRQEETPLERFGISQMRSKAQRVGYDANTEGQGCRWLSQALVAQQTWSGSGLLRVSSSFSRKRR